MAADKLDRRTERTRQTAFQSFVELLLTRGYEDLTVADIIDHANIGRSTFYEHFSGKEDLLQQSLVNPFGPLAGLIGQAEPGPEILAQVLHFREQQRLVRSLFVGATRPLLGRALATMIEPRLAILMRRQPGTAPLIPLALIALHLAEGQLTLIEHWLTSKGACRPEALAEALFLSTNAAAEALLRGPAAAFDRVLPAG